MIPNKVVPYLADEPPNNVGLGEFPDAWLRTKISIEDAEKHNMTTLSEVGSKPIAFGHLNRQWNKFKQIIMPSDELWEVRSPQEEWDRSAGVAGFCIIRKGKVIASILTQMS